MWRNAKNEWANTAMDELERQRLDLALDREFEATFPASDALKITLGKPSASQRSEHREARKPD